MREVGPFNLHSCHFFCRSFPSPPAAFTLDIDDAFDAVHVPDDAARMGRVHDTTEAIGI